MAKLTRDEQRSNFDWRSGLDLRLPVKKLIPIDAQPGTSHDGLLLTLEKEPPV